MKLETFFEKFELFADAPDAVAKMRELVLQLATRGKLVEQTPDDGDVTSLLEAMALARQANGRRKITDSVDAVELPEPKSWHDVPSSWRWVQLGAIGDIVGGGTPRSENSDYFAEEGIPWLTPADLNGFKDKRILRGRRCITQLGMENSSAQLLPEGSVLFSSRAPIGYVAIAGTALATNQGFKSCVPFIKETNEFLYFYLMGAAARIDSEASGTTFPEVSGKIVSQIPVPLPPLAEQKRIVAKVDELMALCDRLEAQQQERETRHAALARASLARFADAPTPANLDFLFHKSYSIPSGELRKSILILAFAGKLVLQDPNDEPASVLLEKARAEKARLIKAGLVKKEPWAHKLEDAATLYELPLGWVWTHVSDVVEKVTVGFVGSMKEEYRLTGVPFLRSQNVRVNRYEPVGLTFISEDFHRSIGKSTLCPGDVVVTRSGNVGVTCVIPASLPEANCSDLVVVKRPIALVPAFLSYFINSIAAGQIEARTVGIALTHFNTQSVAQMTVALPPLAEQRRIVAKVDELMALVDALETQLATARTAGVALLEAALHELLHPTAEIIPFASSERESLPDRAAIGCYAIQRLADKRTFGRTAEVKVLYLAEAHLGLNLGGRYLREAAGPLDQWIYKFEEDAERLQWFSVVEGQTKDGHKKIEYRPGPKLSAKAQEASTRFSAAQRSEFDRLLGLLAQKPTVEVEAIATLFAAWNDFLLDGRQPSDDEIVREVRENWHPSKQRFSEPELKIWLAWLLQHALVPQGRGPHTVGQQGKLQLH